MIHIFVFFLLGKRTSTPLSPESTQAHKVVCDVSAISIDSTIRRGVHPVSTSNIFFLHKYFLQILLSL